LIGKQSAASSSPCSSSNGAGTTGETAPSHAAPQMARLASREACSSASTTTRSDRSEPWRPAELHSAPARGAIPRTTADIASPNAGAHHGSRRSMLEARSAKARMRPRTQRAATPTRARRPIAPEHACVCSRACL
jgi:hypothetical protein